MKRFLSLAVAFCICILALSDSTSERAQSYISTYSSIAVDEMLRSGVPASITLAQGLLESGYGLSQLAVQANNHFGIKCHSDWKGPSMNFDDDRKGECFRKYDKAEDSFRDHSDFLRYKSRYAFLFELQREDYKAWAYGLKKAGYATDPNYAPKLIKLIETYDLGRFDVIQNAEQEELIPEAPAKVEQPERFKGSGRRGTYAVSLSREVLQVNGVPFVYARKDESYKDIASQYRLFYKELLRFNDVDASNAILNAGDVVYLQAKASKAAKGLDKHICREGETLRQISTRYAVSLKALKKLNGMDDADRPLREDDTILLRKASRR